MCRKPEKYPFYFEKRLIIIIKAGEGIKIGNVFKLFLMKMSHLESFVKSFISWLKNDKTKADFLSQFV